MYFLIGISQRSEKSFSVKLQVEGLKDYFIISNNIPDTLKIIARDKKNILDKMTEEDFNVKLDLSNITTTDTYTIKLGWDVPKTMKSFFSSIEVIPGVLTITIEQQSEKIVPIHVDYIGEVQTGFILKRTSVNPPNIRIKGPGTILTDKIKHIKTEQINIKGEEESFTRYVNLISPYSNVSLIGQDKVEVSFSITVEMDFRIFSYYRVIHNNLNKQFKAVFEKFPIRVKVTGPKRNIAALRSEDIILSIDCASFIIPGEYTAPIDTFISNEEIKVVSIIPPNLKLTIKNKE